MWAREVQASVVVGEVAGGHGGADDAGLVEQLSGHDLGAGVEVGKELVVSFADTLRVGRSHGVIFHAASRTRDTFKEDAK